jgi:hypothetical protein
MSDDGSPIRRMILASPSDLSAPWLLDGLHRRGVRDIHLVSVDSLVYSTSMTHRVDRDGEARTEIRLRDGSIVGPSLAWTVNRTQFLPTVHLDAANPPDRDYATQELYAFFTSVLYGLPGRTINRAGPRGLSGPYLAPSEWTRTGGIAGLTVSPYRSTVGGPLSEGPSATLFVLGNEVVTQANQGITPPDHVIEGCQRLAALLDVELLSADFDTHGGQWRLTGGSCTPDLRRGGDLLLDAAARMLR